MAPNRPVAWAIAAMFLALAACGRARQVESGATASTAQCTHCHGGVDNASGAPPNDLSGRADTSAMTVGAHTAHVQAGAFAGAFACTECHPDPLSGTTHGDGKVEVVLGGLAQVQGAGRPAAAFDVQRGTCSNVYCHGATLHGGSRTTPTWTAVGQGQADCGTCHGIPPTSPPHPTVSASLTGCNECHPQTVDAAGAIIPAAAGGKHLNGLLEGGHAPSWITPASVDNKDFHAYSADRDLASCTICHGPKLDGVGGSTTVGCQDCHSSKGPAPELTCTGCHGGTDNATGAPPRATWGNTNPVVVGAHTSHVGTNNALSAPIACSECHVQPASMLSPGHVDGSVTVAFQGALSGQSPGTWSSATTSTCSVYCHGATLSGGRLTTPTWTSVGQGQADCGTCHGLPPPTLRSGSAHPTTSSDPKVCNACHPLTVDPNGAIIASSAGGRHLDGTVQAVFGHDAATWSNPLSPGFHAFAADNGLASCQVCHGVNLDGVGGATSVGCQNCHGTGTAPALTCTGCHGGTDNTTGAPPRAQWLARSNPAESALRTGAHTSHVIASAISPAFACSVCHQTPDSMFTPGHITTATTASVAFTGLAANGVTPAPSWDRTAPTCAVYCHGATLHGGSLTTPTWTAVGQGQAACGTCHGIPPSSPPHPAVSGSLTGCHDCHPETIDATGAMISPLAGGKHLNGVIEGGHTASWITPASPDNPDFHAYSANRGLASCQICHGQQLDGVGGSTTVGCQSCHDGVAATAFNTCTMCHGGTDNTTGAPPRATWGNTSPVAVGAHSSHVGTNPVSAPIACSECHVQPDSMFTPGHVDGAVTVVFQGAISGQAGGTFNPATATCASTWCHGNFPRGSTTNVPIWTATGAACGSCHPARPQGYLHLRHQRQDYTGFVSWWPQPGQSGWVTCDQCHFGIAQSVTSAGTPTLTQVNGGGPPLHVNGTANVVFKLDGTYTTNAIEGTCSSMACHPGEVMAWPK